MCVSATAALAGASRAHAQTQVAAAPQLDRDVADLLARVESALTSGDPEQYLALVSADADRTEAEAFARDVVLTGVTRAVVRERDRAALHDGDTAPAPADVTALRLIVEVFLQADTRGSVATWRLDLQRRDTIKAGVGKADAGKGDAANGDAAGPLWRIRVQERLTTIEGLYRLTLTKTRQFRIRNLQVTSEDLTLSIPQGVAFIADTDQGATGYVLIGAGTMTFQPKPASERGQIKLFAGDEVLRTPFNVAFVRLNPSDAPARLTLSSLIEEPVDRGQANRAEEIFEEEVAKSFNLDLSDLSRDIWSLVPPAGDMLVEVRTGRFGTLTYTQSSNESEDISLFDRRKRRNIAAYASERKLAARPRFYSENDEIDYDVEHYDIQSHFSPDREWIEGRTVLRIRVKAYIMGTLTLRLAESLVVQSVTSPRFGRLLSLRVKGQNSVLVNLPQALARGDEFTLAVSYAGRLASAMPEREVIAVQEGQDGNAVLRTDVVIPPEGRLLYTNRSYWYPQSTVPDYATATMRLTVPEGIACVATGTPATGNPVRLERPGAAPRRLYVFGASQPARYLAVVITRLSPVTVNELLRLPGGAAAITRNVAPDPDRDARPGSPSSSSSAAPRSPTAAPSSSPRPAPPGTGSRLATTLTPPGTGSAPSSGASPGVSVAISRSAAAAASIAQGNPVPADANAEGATQVPPPNAPLDPPAARAGIFYDAIELQVLANPRQATRVRAFADQANAILTRYAEVVGDLPYPSFTLTLVDDQLPGGHSPAYFAVLHQPLPTTAYTWRNDPVSFDKFPQFFVAHELAHQFWGDAVGGENYHEQWISEGFAQYFALLYAERARSRSAFEGILKQMRRTSIAYDRFGPVWLGYRLGHLQGDSRIFRALVYNKGAMVLHMLRRLMGDEAFFRGLRRFYLDSRFTKVGTDDVQRAFEAAAGRSLERFFERWILTSGIPRVAVSHRVDVAAPSSSGEGAPGTASVTITAEQQGEIYDYPLTVRLRYATGESEDVIVAVTDRTVTQTFPLKARLQGLAVNDDGASLVEVVAR